MIDIHAHILPGIDDGASNWNEAVHMAQMAVDGGVSAMIVTPHCNMRYQNFYTPDLIEHKRHFQNMLREYQIPLKLYSGMEIMGSYDVGQQLRAGRLATLNDSRYPLVEFHFTGSGQEETEILDSILRHGYRPIVAHPERYLYVQEQPELLNTWGEMGCLFQINRGSLLGRFGQRAEELSYSMVDRGYADVVASDAHSATQRTPWMADVREMLEEEFSQEVAYTLLEKNPRRILEDQDMPKRMANWF